MNRIAAYIRVSTQKQADEGISITMQKMMIEKHLKLYEIVSTNEEIQYYVDEGVSASSLNRPAMNELVQDIKDHKVEYVFAYDLSRISRDIMDSNVFLKLLRSYGVELKCLIDEVSDVSAGGRLSTNVKLVVNQFEREKIIERTNAGLEALVESGRYPCGGRAPFGYFRGQDKSIYVCPHTSKVVKAVFLYLDQGVVILDVIQKVYEEFKMRLNYDKVYKMVQDKKYIGVFEYKGKSYDGIVPAIIKKEQFTRVNAKSRKISSKDEGVYLFDGLVSCKCGRFLNCVYGKNANSIKYYYYKCPNCKKQISQNSLLDQMKLFPIEKKHVIEVKEGYKKRFANLKHRIRRLEKEYIKDAYDSEGYMKRLQPLEKEFVKVKEMLDYVESIDLNRLNYLQQDKQKVYLKQHIANIIVDINEKKIIKIDYL